MAVVFPAPGGPIITYHGNSFRCRRPFLDLRSAAIAVLSLAAQLGNLAVDHVAAIFDRFGDLFGQFLFTACAG